MCRDREPEIDTRKLRALRARIDRIDDEITALLNRRAGSVIEIGGWKEQSGVPVYDPDRERQILDRLSRGNGGPLADAAVRRLFERIIDESRRLERTSRTVPEGEEESETGG
jgi:chorismate mutase